MLAGNYAWQKSLEKWKPGVRYYWDGKSHSILDGISTKQGKYFLEIIEKQKEVRPKLFVLSFLLKEKHLGMIPFFVMNFKNADIAWELCLAAAWQKIKQGKNGQASSLFDLAKQSNLKKELKSEVSYGSILAKVLMGIRLRFQDKRALKGKTSYKIGKNKVDFFRDYSTLTQYKSSLTKLPVEFLIADMCFVLGRNSSKRRFIWQKGLRFLGRHKKKFSGEKAEIYQCLMDRFKIAMSWSYFIIGKYNESQKIFKTFVVDKAKKIWHDEAQLGLCLISWKQESDLEDIVEKYKPISWPSYGLGGRKISFFRTTIRDKNRKAIENLCKKQTKHQIYLVVLDALCILGDGEASKKLLADVMEQVAKNPDVQSLYLAEQVNIPKNVYAENQIWEKLD